MAEFGVGSDYKCEVRFVDEMGVVVDPLSLKWELAFFVYKDRMVVASYDGERLTNCTVEGDLVVCGFDAPGFSAGEVRCRKTLFIEDVQMADGVQTIVCVVKTGDRFV